MLLLVFGMIDFASIYNDYQSVRQGAGAAFRDESELPHPESDLWFIDTCQAWRSDGPLAERMRARDLTAIRKLSARKPTD